MNKFLKVALITAGITMSVGIAAFAIGTIANGGKPISFYWNDGFKLSTQNTIVQKEKTKIEDFKDVLIDVSAANVFFYENTDDTYAFEYRISAEREDAIQCEVQNDKFILKEKNSPIRLFSGLDWNSWGKKDEYYVKVYYPKGAEFGDIYLDTSAGDVSLEQDLTCAKLTLDMSAGKAKLKNIKGALDIDMSAGDLNCDDCEFGFCTIDMSAGSVKMNNCSADGGKVDMSAGGFTANSFTLTKSMSLDMSAGSVTIDFVDGQKIGYDFDLSAGTAKINGEKRGDEFQQIEGYDVILKVDASAGSVDVTNH